MLDATMDTQDQSPTPPRRLEIPQEICDIITEHLQPADALRLRLVCRTFAVNFDHDILMRRRQSRTFRILLDDIGIKDIEALANSAFANEVEELQIADHYTSSMYLETTSFESHKPLPTPLCRPGMKQGIFYDVSFELGEDAMMNVDMYSATPVVVIRGSDKVGGPSRLNRYRKYTRALCHGRDMHDLQFSKLVGSTVELASRQAILDFTCKRLNNSKEPVSDINIKTRDRILRRFAKLLHKFPNLKTISSLRRNVIVIKGVTGDHSHIPSLKNLSRVPDLCLPNRTPADRLESLLPCWNYDKFVAVWPCLHSLGRLVVHLPLGSSFFVALRNLKLHIYDARSYPHELSTSENIPQLAKLIHRCTNLETLALHSGHIGEFDISYPDIESQVDILLAQINTFPVHNKLRSLAVERTSPTSDALLTLLTRHQDTLQDIKVASCKDSDDIDGWLALFTTIIDMPNVKDVWIEIAEKKDNRISLGPEDLPYQWRTQSHSHSYHYYSLTMLQVVADEVGVWCSECRDDTMATLEGLRRFAESEEEEDDDDEFEPAPQMDSESLWTEMLAHISL